MAILVRLYVLAFEPQRRSALLVFVQIKRNADRAAQRLAVGIGLRPAEIHQRGNNGACLLRTGNRRDRQCQNQQGDYKIHGVTETALQYILHDAKRVLLPVKTKLLSHC